MKELFEIQSDVLGVAADLINERKARALNEVIIATKNSGKAKEFVQMFESYGITVKTLINYPELPETRPGNVRGKCTLKSKIGHPD